MSGKKIGKNWIKVLILMMIILCVSSLIIMIIVLCIPKEKVEEFVYPPFEKLAEYGMPEVSPEFDWREIDVKEFKFCVNGKVTREENLINICLFNPSENRVWLKARILGDDGQNIGETGIIKPGESIRCVEVEEILDVGMPVELKIMAYSPETYYSEGAVSVKTYISK